jgi:hypothetical protein
MNLIEVELDGFASGKYIISWFSFNLITKTGLI